MTAAPDGAFVVADLEYTTWEGALARNWSGPGEFKEIVQIGAVRVSAGGAVTSTFSALVRPTLNPRLSEYFSELTGITDADVAREGQPLRAALDAFHRFAAGLPILTHGPDEQVVANDCAKKNLVNPFAGADWRDIAPAIRDLTGERLMSSELPAFFGLDAPGRAHDALADAQALTQVLMHLGGLENVREF